MPSTKPTRKEEAQRKTQVMRMMLEHRRIAATQRRLCSSGSGAGMTVMVGMPCARMILEWDRSLEGDTSCLGFGCHPLSPLPAPSIPTMLLEMLFFPFIAITWESANTLELVWTVLWYSCASLLSPAASSGSLPPLGCNRHDVAGHTTNLWVWGAGGPSKQPLRSCRLLPAAACSPAHCQDRRLGGSPSLSMSGGGRLHRALARGWCVHISSAASSGGGHDALRPRRLCLAPVILCGPF